MNKNIKQRIKSNIFKALGIDLDLRVDLRSRRVLVSSIEVMLPKFMNIEVIPEIIEESLSKSGSESKDFCFFDTGIKESFSFIFEDVIGDKKDF